MAERRIVNLITSAGGVASDVVNFAFNNEYRRLVRVRSVFDGTAPATSIVTVTGGDGVAALTTPAGNTARDDYPTGPVVTAAGAAVTNGAAAPLIRGPITVAVSAGGAAKPVAVSLFLE